MLRRILIAAAVLLILLPVALVGVLVYTPVGVRLIDSQLPRLERFGVRIEGLSGTLSGPLRVERFELDLPRVHIVAHEIVADPQMRGLLLQTVSIGSLTGRDVEVELRAVEDLPPPQRPLRFLPEFLRVNVRAAELTRVRYMHVNGTEVQAERLTGRARLSPRQIRIRQFAVEADRFDADGDLRLRAQRPVALELSAQGNLRLPSGVELMLGGSLDGTADELGIEANLMQPSIAAAQAMLTRPDGEWRIAGQVTSPAFSFEPWLDRPPFSLRDVALDVTATPAEIAVAGTVGVPELDSRNLTLAARGRYTDRVLHVASADVRLHETQARAHASGTVSFDGGPPTLEVTTSWSDLRWPLSGAAMLTSARGDLALHGALPYRFEVNAQVEGEKVPQMTGTARGVFARERLLLDAYRVAVFGGELSGRGTLELAQPRKWTATVHARDVDPGHWHAEFPGRVRLTAEGHGRGLDRDTLFEVTIRDLGGTLREQRLGGKGTIERDAGGWRARDANLRFGDTQLTLDGRWGQALDLRWSLESGSLSALLPQAAGSVKFAGSATGPPKSAHVVADLRAEDLRYGDWRADQLSVNGDVDLAGNANSSLRIHARRAGHGGPMVESLRITGAGTASQHDLDITATSVRQQPTDRVQRADIHTAGRYTDGIWTATLTTSVKSGEQPWLEMTEPATVVVSRERALVDDLCIAVGPGTVCAQGNWQRGGAWQGTLSGTGLKLASLLPAGEGTADYAGEVEGRVQASARAGERWQGEASLRIKDAAVLYRPPGAEPETLQLGSGEVEATANPERIDAALSLKAFTETFVYARAQLLRNGRDLLHMPLSGEFRARAADANILPILMPEIDDAAGVLTANARIGGTLAAPELDGRVRLTDGELDAYRLNLALRDLSATADLTSNRLQFTGSARAGEGRLEAQGGLTWEAGTSRGQLTLQGRNLLLADLPEYRVVASPDLRFDIDGRQIEVTGEVTIPSALIQPVDLSGAVKVSEDARYVDEEHPAEKAGRFAVRSQIRVNVGEDVRLDTFGLQGRLTGRVATTLRSGEVATGRGELSIVEGRYEAYGQKLDITRGRLLFEATPLDDPGLDIETRRKIENVLVGLNVRGTLRAPRLTFFSDPSMPQTQIVSYLLVGKPIENMQSRDAATVGSATDALALQGGGVLASQLGRRLGLQEVGVESSVDSSGETNTALVLGKFLSPRLFVSYGISLTESINTFKVRYTLSDRWILKTEAGEHQSIDAEYTIER